MKSSIATKISARTMKVVVLFIGITQDFEEHPPDGTGLVSQTITSCRCKEPSIDGNVSICLALTIEDALFLMTLICSFKSFTTLTQNGWHVFTKGSESPALPKSIFSGTSQLLYGLSDNVDEFILHLLRESWRIYWNRRWPAVQFIGENGQTCPVDVWTDKFNLPVSVRAQEMWVPNLPKHVQCWKN